MTPAELQGRLLSLAVGLGANEAGVAATLRQAGATGLRGAACDCPVAAYLRKRLLNTGVKGLINVIVSDDWISLRMADGEFIDVATPPAVREFIGAFDSGCHPDLVVAVEVTEGGGQS